jgi:hypothetical protein
MAPAVRNRRNPAKTIDHDEAVRVDPGSLRRVAFAAFAGTTIEFYDYFIYGTAAALVFGTVFFPALGAAAGTVAALATFVVAFLARPLGSARRARPSGRSRWPPGGWRRAATPQRPDGECAGPGEHQDQARDPGLGRELQVLLVGELGEHRNARVVDIAQTEPARADTGERDGAELVPPIAASVFVRVSSNATGAAAIRAATVARGRRSAATRIPAPAATPASASSGCAEDPSGSDGSSPANPAAAAGGAAQAATNRRRRAGEPAATAIPTARPSSPARLIVVASPSISTATTRPIRRLCATGRTATATRTAMTSRAAVAFA